MVEKNRKMLPVCNKEETLANIYLRHIRLW